MAETQDIDATLTGIWNQFNANLGTLWAFSQQIGRLADEQDKTDISELARKLSLVFDEDVTDIQKDLSRWFPDSDDIEITPEGITTLVAELKDLNSDDFKQTIVAWSNENPEMAHELSGLLRIAFKQPPAHAKLLRWGALINLVSFFEILEWKLICAFYLLVCQALPSEEMTIKVAELRGLESLDEVNKYIIHKEADSVIREGLLNQLKYFKDRLIIDKMKLMKDSRDELVEIVQRRNLLVHNQGIVNQIYLTHVSKQYLQDKRIKKDCILHVSAKYLDRALDTVHLFGFVLSQLCWRKWVKDKHEAADKVFAEFSFDTLTQGRFDLTKRTAHCAAAMGISKQWHRIITINQAIAFRELGEIDKIRGLLKKYEWTPMPIDIEIGLSTLREDYERTYLLLEQAAYSGDLKKISKDWPLFKPIRQEVRFVQVFDQYSDTTAKDLA